MAGYQAPSAVMMVKPFGFGYNPETAASNAFQQSQGKEDETRIQSRALSEYEGLVSVLRSWGVEVIEFSPDNSTDTPDAVFPNNWVSFHDDGTVILYPMMAPSRRLERRLDYINALEQQHQFQVSKIVDLSYYEDQQRYLEGTGSLVIDYVNNVIYANHSPRTSSKLVNKVAEMLKCGTCQFTAVDDSGLDIFHTNVLMCVGDHFTVVCLDALNIPEERLKLASSLKSHGHEIVNITVEQMKQFAGNMMQLRSIGGDSILAMSESAYSSLDKEQIKTLEQYARLVYAPIDTIEKYGGGSVRCMMAGIFLPKNSKTEYPTPNT
jgi:hypothetical protein